MADSIIRLRVDSKEYDNKLKQAADGLTRYADRCRKVGGTLEVVEKDTLNYVKAVGQMETKSRTANGKLAEMRKAFIDLGHQYKQLTDAERQSPFGKAMAQSLDQLRTRIQQSKSQLEDLNREISGATSSGGGGFIAGLGSKMEGALAVFGGNMMTKAVDLAGSLAMKLQDAVSQGIALAEAGEGVQMAFDRLNRPDLLSNLREATHGTVTDLELMKAAVRFQDFNLPLEELGTMLAFAQQKAKDTGQSIDYMTESIVTGLGRKSVMILDNLGISAAEIKERMAETGDMTKAVGAIIRDQMERAGDYVETAADRAKRAEVDLQNAMTELGNTLLPLKAQGTDVFTAIEVSLLHMLNDAAKPAVPVLLGLGETLDDLKSIATDNWVADGFANWMKEGLDYATRIIPVISTLRGIIAGLRDMGAPAAGAAGGASVGGAIAGLIPTNGGGGGGNTTTTPTSPVKIPVTPVITPGSESDYRNQIKMLNDVLLQETTSEGREVIHTMINELQFKIQQLDGYTRIGGLDSDMQGVSIAEMGTQAVSERQNMLQNGQLNRLDLENYKGTRETWGDKDKDKENLKSTEKNTDAIKNLSGVVSGVSTVASGLQQMGFTLNSDIVQVMSFMQGVISVVQGVSTIISIFSTTSQAALTTATMASAGASTAAAAAAGSNTVAIGMNTAAITALAAEMKMNTAVSIFKPFAHGGVVRAASGFVVPGNNMSGDMVPALLNSGETVFNRAQMGVLASELSGNRMSDMHLSTEIEAESIRIILGDFADRTGNEALKAALG